MDIIEEENDVSNNEKPPFFKDWRSWYILVIGELVLLILLFYWFTNAFS